MLFEAANLLPQSTAVPDNWYIEGVATCLTCMTRQEYCRQLRDPSQVAQALARPISSRQVANQPDQIEPPVSLAAIIAAYYQERAR